METPDPPSDTPGASKKVFLTPHDIPRILRVKTTTKRSKPWPFRPLEVTNRTYELKGHVFTHQNCQVLVDPQSFWGIPKNIQKSCIKHHQLGILPLFRFEKNLQVVWKSLFCNDSPKCKNGQHFDTTSIFPAKTMFDWANRHDSQRILVTNWSAKVNHIPNNPCMVYFPTFSLKINQM